MGDTRHMKHIITYIIETSSGEFYCGKTFNLPKRIYQHKLEKYPHWFCSEKRKHFVNILYIFGDYEKKIKSFGVSKFMFINNNLKKFTGGV